MAAGGLAGGIGAGIFSHRLRVQKAGNLIVIYSICAFPMGIAPAFFSSGMVNYSIMAICCFGIMACSTVFTVQMMSFVQEEVPRKLLGKVIAVILAIAMCAQPLGNAFYGILFERCTGYEYMVILFAAIATLAIAVNTRRIFASLRK